MEQISSTIKFNTAGQGFTDITAVVNRFIINNDFISGIIILNTLHTSCGLTINENADPNVLKDLSNYIESIVPYNSYKDLSLEQNENYYAHYQEGEDDMPAHIKTALTNNSLSLSFQNQKLTLGNWQSIYLWEHRFDRKERLINIHLIGEKRN
tara:strand:+ start:4761 stop:5219 length:459 start_codon:yes stop_codon:yes gene_type:complete